MARVVALVPDLLFGSKVVSMLESLPGLGKVKARKIMEEVGIADNRKIQGLGAQQKKALLDHLASHGGTGDARRAAALVNPNRLDEDDLAASHGHLAAVGVAFGPTALGLGDEQAASPTSRSTRRALRGWWAWTSGRLRSASSENVPQLGYSGGIGFFFSQPPSAYL